MNNNLFVIRLVSKDISKTIANFKKESLLNGNNFYNNIIDYVVNSPYGKKNKMKDEKDFCEYLQKRVEIENKIINKCFKNNYLELESNNYKISDITLRTEII